MAISKETKITYMLILSLNNQQSTRSYDLHIHVQAAKAYEENMYS